MEQTADLAARYGTRRPVRRLALVVVTVVVGGAALGWLVWSAWLNSDPAVSAGVEGYSVTSAHRMEVTVQVRVRDRYVRGRCLVQATASDHSVVGERTFDVDRAGRQRVTVRTEREATTVEVAQCTQR